MSEFYQKFASFVKFHDPIVTVTISHEEIPIMVDGHIRWFAEMLFIRAWLQMFAKFEEQFKILIIFKYLKGKRLKFEIKNCFIQKPKKLKKFFQ